MNSNISVQVENLNKSFGPTRALTDINFDLFKGEVHSVVGQNGAGKSTFIKILSGEYIRDSGNIFLFGEKKEFSNPADVRNLNIYTVYQELKVMPQLTVAENIFMNNYLKEEKGLKNLISWKRMNLKAKEYLVNWNLDINPEKLLGNYPLAVQQIIEILKNYILNPKVLILDEPTSSLDNDEVKFLFSIINKLKKEGVSIIFISHILEEVFEISDRITIFRDSRNVGTFKQEEINQTKLISLMVGEDIGETFQLEEKQLGQEVVFELCDFTRKGFFSNLNLKVKNKEILGIIGVRGAGKSELARSILGLEKFESGEIFINNKKVKINSVDTAIKKGIGYIPEDRKNQGLFLVLPVIDNLTMTIINKLLKYHLISETKRTKLFNKYRDMLNIKLRNPNQEMFSLSGGNQQKVLIGRGLASEPNVLIADEPTRGIDVGTKKEVYRILNNIAISGAAVIYLTDEPDEALGLCDRIIVIGKGKLLGEYKKGELNKKELLLIMTEGVES